MVADQRKGVKPWCRASQQVNDREHPPPVRSIVNHCTTVAVWLSDQLTDGGEVQFSSILICTGQLSILLISKVQLSRRISKIQICRLLVFRIQIFSLILCVYSSQTPTSNFKTKSYSCRDSLFYYCFTNHRYLWAENHALDTEVRFMPPQIANVIVQIAVSW